MIIFTLMADLSIVSANITTTEMGNLRMSMLIIRLSFPYSKPPPQPVHYLN